MAHDGAVPPALGDDGLRGVVRGVHVHVGHGSEELVAPAQGVVTEGRARKPLHRAVHSHVQHGIRAEPVFLLKPLVVRGVLRMRREISLKEQTHGIPLDAESRLDADEHVADLQSGDERSFPGDGREAVVGLERAPRVLHVAHQHVRSWKERHGSPFRGAPIIRETKPLLQARGGHVLARDAHAV